MRNIRRLLVTGAFAAMASSGLIAFGAATTPDSSPVACDQNIVPYDPYHQTCGIPNPIPAVPGASPGAGTIIACRNIPGCLSQAVNGPQLVAVPRTDTTVRQSR